jgi:hypothetical protein
MRPMFLYMIGWRYADRGTQLVHKGRFIGMDDGTVLVSLDSPPRRGGAGVSGSPVIDAQGYVVGIMSAGAGEEYRYRLAPVAYALDVLDEYR